MVFQLAAHPEYIPLIREEMHSLINVPATSHNSPDENGSQVSYDTLQRATILDSFIREVMRTKGDTLSTARMTTKDVPIAGYTIPKGKFFHLLKVTYAFPLVLRKSVTISHQGFSETVLS